MRQTCKKCQTEKPLSDFELRSDTGKLRQTCRACRNVRLAELYPARADKIKAANLRWRAANPEKFAEYTAAYSAANREIRNARSLAWAQQNKEVANARSVAWRKEHGDRVREAARLLREADPDHYRTKVRNRRARLKTTGAHTARDVAMIREEQGDACGGCQVSLTKSGYHVDHVRALANGGTNDRNNLQLLCPTCNLSKGTQDLIEWMRSKGFFDL